MHMHMHTHHLVIGITFVTLIPFFLTAESLQGDYFLETTDLLTLGESLSTDHYFPSSSSSSSFSGDVNDLFSDINDEQDLEEDVPTLTFDQVAIPAEPEPEPESEPEPDSDRDFLLASVCVSESERESENGLSLPFNKLRAARRDEDRRLCSTKEPVQDLLKFPDMLRTLGRLIFGEDCPVPYNIDLYCDQGSPDAILYNGPPIVWAKLEGCYPGGSGLFFYFFSLSSLFSLLSSL